MEKSPIISEFLDLTERPFHSLKKWKARTGQKILGYFCTNTPEEIIQAAGVLPVRILGSQIRISLATQHLQSYCCSLVQTSLESALLGDLSFLDGTIFPHTCDSIQRLSDIWAENLSFPFHWDLILPVKLHTASARTYLIQELNRFRHALREFTGSPMEDEDLHASFALANANRSMLRRLYEIKNRNAALFSAVEFAAVVRGAMLSPPTEYGVKLEKLLSWAGQPHPPVKQKVRLFVAGSICDSLSWFDLLDASGVSMVGDDLCTGWRYFSDDVSTVGNPVEALADRLIRKVPCPCKYNPELDRGKELVRRVEESNARGVIFLLPKFCDPHGFDYPYLKERLAGRKIPTLLLEIEPGGIPQRGAETRMKAFVETLGG